MGSRSLQQGGAAVWNAAAELVNSARKLAAKLLEADEADITLDKDAGTFHVTGTPAIAKGWADLAQAAHGDPDLPEGLQHALFFQAGGATFPFGAHVAVVRPARSATCDTSHATTPARSSTRCCWRARSTVASPRARPRH